ncbi:MAG: hypothetical protein IT320_20200 [Anaerolineae bacterium]|nr:hypothetical protein [Anaerolineae bacterium]
MNFSIFHEPGEQIGDLATLGEFWRWALSDLLNNRNRGVLAEFIVAKLLEIPLTHPRIEWDCADLKYREHLIEVKSAAYIQSWHQADERSTIQFDVSPHSCWDGRTNTYREGIKRWADLYVFTLFPRDPLNLSRDILDVSQWIFYVASTANLNETLGAIQKSVGLSTLIRICGHGVGARELKPVVDATLKL